MHTQAYMSGAEGKSLVARHSPTPIKATITKSAKRLVHTSARCVHDPASLFDHYLNLCPRQGSRTIRSEEAVLVGMAALRPHVERAQAVR